MRVIFLDMDGVLNRGGAEESMLNPRLISTFKKMLPQTGASVVISSSWKHNGFMLGEIKTHVCDFIDTTPFVNTGNPDSTQRRGIEIQAWLDAHPEVERYAIIDDTGLMLDHQKPNFFQTIGVAGLTEDIAEKVIEHFKKP